MNHQTQWTKALRGFHLSTRDWAIQSRFQESPGGYRKDYPGDYYEFTDLDHSEAYSEPKGLENPVHWQFSAASKRTPPPTFLAVIPGGRVCGAKGAVIAPDNKLLWDLSMDYGITAAEHPLLQMKRLPPLQKYNGRLAVLTFCASQYYYHWMFDVLPRLYLLYSKKIKVDRIILNYNRCNYSNRAYPFQRETLSLLGLPEEKIVECHHLFHLQAQQLVAPSPTGYTGHMPKWTCDFLRNMFLPKEQHRKLKGYERLYISRENAGVRRVLNEEKVVNILTNYGFKKIAPEKMPITEQISIFSSAKIIVSAHGGGLTNLVFCNPGTKVIEFFSPNYVNVLYWILSSHLHLDYYYLIGEGKRPAEHVDPHIVWDNLVVSPGQLSAILKKAGI